MFRSSQSTSQVSREKSPMVVVGGLSHRPSLMSEFSQSATTTRAERTPRDATYLPVAASSASSSGLNRTTDGSRRYLPTYPTTTTTTTTVQCQRAIDETQWLWLWLWLCLCRWDATNGFFCALDGSGEVGPVGVVQFGRWRAIQVGPENPSGRKAVCVDR